jgi:hypothetical protein
MGKSAAISNINYFDWAMFNSYVRNYQRVTNLIYVDLSENLGEKPQFPQISGYTPVIKRG